MVTYVFAFFVLGIAILVAAISVRGGVDASGMAIAIFLATGVLVLLASRMYRKRLGSNMQTTVSASSQLNDFLPSPRNFVLSMALLCYLLAIVEIISRGSLTSYGRWAWLKNLAIEEFGAYGGAIIFSILDVMLTIIVSRP